MSIEFLIKAVDFTHAESGIDLKGAYKRGDPVIVFPSGHIWGRQESKDVWIQEGNIAEDFPSKFYIFKIPEMDIREARQYIIEHRTPSGIRNELLIRRLYRFNIDEFSAQKISELNTNFIATFSLDDINQRIQNKVTLARVTPSGIESSGVIR